jgi:hypothetical protein
MSREHDFIKAEDLQKALREFGGPLETISVVTDNQLVPHMVKLIGVVKLHGAPSVFEAQFNLREIGGVADIMRLAGLLLQNFETANALRPADTKYDGRVH